MANEYNVFKKEVETWRRKFPSPIVIQQEITEKYGDKAAEEMSADEAHDYYKKAIGWAMNNDIAMQDYFAYGCEFDVHARYSEPQKAVTSVVNAIKEMADHLQRGKELGLSELEQRVVDTLWSWVPHNYPDNYVACAREVAEVIVRQIPPNTEIRTQKNYYAYMRRVMPEAEQIAKRYDVELDPSAFDTSTAYFQEWLADEYGYDGPTFSKAEDEEEE